MAALNGSTSTWNVPTSPSSFLSESTSPLLDLGSNLKLTFPIYAPVTPFNFESSNATNSDTDFAPQELDIKDKTFASKQQLSNRSLALIRLTRSLQHILSVSASERPLFPSSSRLPVQHSSEAFAESSSGRTLAEAPRKLSNESRLSTKTRGSVYLDDTLDTEVLYSELFMLDLPCHISRDSSELDYLRRTNSR